MSNCRSTARGFFSTPPATLAVLAALCVAALAPRLARADNVQVNYTVDDKALKDAISGTPLTFDLWSDPNCTAAVTSVQVTIDNVDLIERIKRFKPKHGTTPPKTDRMTEVLTGVTPPQAPYLTVTGTGITPVGGACQAQYGSLAGGGSIPCLTQIGNEVYFTGCNVNVRSGAGSTYAAVNGLGNLVVGYNENPDVFPRTGSHNLIVGSDNGYSSSGGFAAGYGNRVLAPAASVSGGSGNVASGDSATVSGGSGNVASGLYATVSGGTGNVASLSLATVSGGFENTASGGYATVSGGKNNTASGDYATVSGGENNTASGNAATVGGGNGHTQTVNDGWLAGTGNTVVGGSGALLVANP